MSGKLGLGNTTLALGVFAALVILYPLVFSSSYGIGVGITAGAMAAGSVGFVLLLGYAHQLALGQAGFCMIGGYASAILCVRYRWDPTLALLVGAVLSMAVAWVVAVPILKLRGFVLAMGSLALHLILIVFAFELTALTGGALGTYGVQRFALFGDHADHGSRLLFPGLGGRAAVRRDRAQHRPLLRRPRAEGDRRERDGRRLGRHRHRHATRCRCSWSRPAWRASSGSLFVHFLRAMDPTVFGFAFSLNLITAVIIGGLMSIWGAAIGAHGRHRPARGAARILAADVGIRHHGRAHGDRADRLPARPRGLHRQRLMRASPARPATRVPRSPNPAPPRLPPAPTGPPPGEPMLQVHRRQTAHSAA